MIVKHKSLMAAVLTSTLFAPPLFAVVQVINGADVVGCDANCQASGVDFQTDNKLTVQNTENIGNTAGDSVTASGGPSVGTLQFDGTSSVSGNITSAGNILKLITINGGAVTTSGHISATTVNFAADGSLSIANTKTLTSNVTTSTNNTGKLTFAGNGTMTGTIGTTGGNKLKIVELAGANTLNTSGDINATSFNFLANGVLNVAAGKNINGEVHSPAGGGGTVNFAGSSTSGGDLGSVSKLTAVNMNGGTFSLGHDIYATTTTVAANATLTPTQNNKTVYNNLVLNGTLNLASNTLNVVGVYSQNNKSDLNITVTGGTTPTSGKVVDTGNASVNANSNVAISFTGGAVPDNSKIQIISSGGGLGVNVPTVTGNTLTYTLRLETENGVNPGQNLFLIVDRRSFPEASNFSTKGVTTVLENIAVTPNSAPNLNFLIGALNNLATEQELINAITTLIPPVEGSLMAASHHSMQQGFSQTTKRIESLRLARQPAGYAYASGDDLSNHGWVQLYGNDIKQNSREGVAGYTALHGGMALGTDVQIEDDYTFGAAFNYAYTDIDSKGFGQNNTTIQTYQGIAYGSHDFSIPFYVDLLFSLAYHDYDAKRHIIVPPGVGGLTGIRSTAFGDFKAWQYGAAGKLGYDWVVQDFLINPYLFVRYSHLNADDYRETGAGPLNLNVSYKNMSELVFGGGLKLSKAYQFNQFKVVPSLHVEFAEDWDTNRQVSTATFIGGGTSFISPGPTPDDTIVHAGASLEVYSQNNRSVELFYDYETRTDYKVHSAFVKYKFTW